MDKALSELKKNYEKKLIEFESLLKESNKKINELQKSYLDDPLMKAIHEDPTILQTLKANMENKNATL